jgi:hypothetical protein
VGSLKRPDPLPQPGQEVEIVGQTPKKRLAKMDMRLDETGANHSAIKVNDITDWGFETADTADAIIFDQNVAIDDVVVFVHRDNPGIPQDRKPFLEIIPDRLFIYFRHFISLTASILMHSW